MSKVKFTEEDTIRLGLVEKVEINGEVQWKVAKNSPAWVYKYLMQRGVDKDNMSYNLFSRVLCADWLRVHEPEKAISLGLADTMKFHRYPGCPCRGVCIELHGGSVQRFQRGSLDKADVSALPGSNG